MSTFTLTQKAKADLKFIAAYSQRNWGKGRRRVYLKQFDDAFHLLAETPELGINCDSIREGYRKFPHLSHVIFYRSISSSSVEIVRVLHKRMDTKSNLRNP